MALRILTLLLLVCAVPARAQTVRGHVTERDTQHPIAGAFVILLDASGSRVGATLTGAEGEFEQRAPHAGAYRLRVERIGMQTVTSGTFEIGEGQTVPYEMRVDTRTVMLAPITAEANARCTVRPSGGVPLEQVWNEARKALTLAAWTQEQGGVPFTTMTYERTREVVGLRIGEEERKMSSGYDRKTFFSAPAEELAARGYVREGPNGDHLYFGVDAGTLLSDAFLDTHCFRIRDAPRDRPELAGLLGLEFEPVRGHPHPDIQGVLWLDRASSRLKHLEFQYTRHLQPWPVPLERFGGRVEFTPLENGAWIVERWWIRMPQFGRIVPARMMIGARVVRPDDLPQLAEHELASAAELMGFTVREAGGEVVLVHDVDRIGAARSGTAALEGVVVDARETPLVGAVVYVAGTHHATRTDAAGRFRLVGLPEGTQRVSFFHPRTDSLLLVVPLREVALSPGATATVTLGVPREGQCPGTGEARHAALLGQVRNADADSAVGEAVIWASFTRAGARRARGSAQPMETRSDNAGRYLLCGLPVAAELNLRAAALFLRVESINRRFETEGLYHHDFTLSANP
ncbi:MAG TPA: carboxypeptidase-like regulatory domain-containing protein [Longimicrobium sp.]|nr:carboxypeptidase-like regulatory domain-containing protein [Longimicrobium sp.]